MEDAHRIFIDQLRDGKVEKINLSFPPAILGVEESDLSFAEPIRVRGEAYITEDALILHLDLESTAVIPCSICNRPVIVPILAKGIYQVVPLDEIRTRIFDLTETVRENILLEVPPFAECENGKCPERKTLAKYLKENSESEAEGYRPFENLK